ncbi:hypothetical protein [Cognatiluteimonas weifangensis]|uniref:hypothetical protein n=1 Tax=Cognatiluteimonas weifangensis TaxID=2303539 RepID=UPI0011C10210|nr:hypothetical protein [Luteimonas weifangensis]
MNELLGRGTELLQCDVFGLALSANDKLQKQCQAIVCWNQALYRGKKPSVVCLEVRYCRRMPATGIKAIGPEIRETSQHILANCQGCVAAESHSVSKLCRQMREI